MSVLRRFAYTKILAFSLALLVLSSCGGGGSGDGGGGTTGSGLPDLAITSFSAPTVGVAGNSYTVNVTVANVGSVTAAGVSAIIALAPTSDIATDFGMIGLGTSFAILGPGQSTVLSVTATLPSGAANGSYYIGAIVPYGPEVTKANNTTAQAFALSGGTTCASDAHEPDNSPAAAGALSFGVSQSHNHCEGTSDWLRFSAVQGTTYALSTSQVRSEEHTSELQSPDHLVCRLLLEKKNSHHSSPPTPASRPSATPFASASCSLRPTPVRAPSPRRSPCFPVSASWRDTSSSAPPPPL